MEMEQRMEAQGAKMFSKLRPVPYSCEPKRTVLKKLRSPFADPLAGIMFGGAEDEQWPPTDLQKLINPRGFQKQPKKTSFGAQQHEFLAGIFSQSDQDDSANWVVEQLISAVDYVSDTRTASFRMPESDFLKLSEKKGKLSGGHPG